MARHELTVGVEFVIRSIEIDGKKIKIDIWDTVSFSFLPLYLSLSNG